MNASLAFVMSFASFYTNRATSTLSMAVVGNIKQIALVVCAAILFRETFDTLKLSGVLLTILGGFFYTFARAKEQEAARAEQAPKAPSQV